MQMDGHEPHLCFNESKHFDAEYQDILLMNTDQITHATRAKPYSDRAPSSD
jgi:hypothetical protein